MRHRRRPLDGLRNRSCRDPAIRARPDLRMHARHCGGHRDRAETDESEDWSPSIADAGRLHPPTAVPAKGGAGIEIGWSPRTAGSATCTPTARSWCADEYLEQRGADPGRGRGRGAPRGRAAAGRARRTEEPCHRRDLIVLQPASANGPPAVPEALDRDRPGLGAGIATPNHVLTVAGEARPARRPSPSRCTTGTEPYPSALPRRRRPRSADLHGRHRAAGQCDASDCWLHAWLAGVQPRRRGHDWDQLRRMGRPGPEDPGLRRARARSSPGWPGAWPPARRSS